MDEDKIILLVNWETIRSGSASGVFRVASLSGVVVDQTVYGFGGWDGQYGHSDVFGFHISTFLKGLQG